jgi:hypothetical protein
MHDRFTKANLHGGGSSALGWRDLTKDWRIGSIILDCGVMHVTPGWHGWAYVNLRATTFTA